MVVAFWFVAVISLAPLPDPQVTMGHVQSIVTTIAGDGVAGMSDGPNSSARFLEPFAVAYDNSKLYVIDRAAQRIRLIADGMVTTVAGSGVVDKSQQHVPGGYLDGPALSAQFNEPTGIAVGSDGSLYVADSGNHCIRKIFRGVVSTYAGAHARLESADGDLASAGIATPRAISFDSSGNMFVADYHVGIREIARNGIVTTLPLEPGNHEITGVSVTSNGKQTEVLATDGSDLVVYSDIEHLPSRRLDSEAGRFFGRPYGIAAYNSFEFVISDISHHVVKLLRAPQPPYVSAWEQTELAGLERGSKDLAAGFRDGPTFEAKLNSPTGIAISNHGVVAIADSGNRRIRLVRLPDMRMPVGNNVASFHDFPNSYKICFVSSSQAHYRHWWSDSTAGAIEFGLQSRWANLKIPQKPVLFSARIDGSNVAKESLFDWVEEIPGQGLADMVVLSVTSSYPSEAPGRAAFTALLKHLNGELRQNNVRLFLAVYPSSVEISPLEGLEIRDSSDSQDGESHDDTRFNTFADIEADFAQSVKDSGVPFYSAFDDMQRYERGSRNSLLFGLVDSHFTEFGSYYYGTLIESSLELQRPWLKNN